MQTSRLVVPAVVLVLAALLFTACDEDHRPGPVATPTTVATAAPTATATAAPTPTSTPSAAEQGCVESGGTVSSGLCCESAGDFPNTCAIGVCGCAPGSSHEVKLCECGEGQCFDGTACVAP